MLARLLSCFSQPGIVDDEQQLSKRAPDKYTASSTQDASPPPERKVEDEGENREEDYSEQPDYVEPGYEDDYDEDEVESLATIAEQGESQCTPMTESVCTELSKRMSSFNTHEAGEPPKIFLEPAKSVLEAVSSQLTSTTTKEPRNRALLMKRIEALEDSGEQFAFMMAGKARIRYKSRSSKKSTATASVSTPGKPTQGVVDSTPTAPKTPSHAPGVSVDLEDSNYFNYFAPPPLEEHASGSTQEGSSGTSHHLTGSQHEGSGIDTPRKQTNCLKDAWSDSERITTSRNAALSCPGIDVPDINLQTQSGRISSQLFPKHATQTHRSGGSTARSRGTKHVAHEGHTGIDEKGVEKSADLTGEITGDIEQMLDNVRKALDIQSSIMEEPGRSSNIMDGSLQPSGYNLKDSTG